MSSSSTSRPVPEGSGSASGAPHLPDGFTSTFTSRCIDTGQVRLHAVIGGGTQSSSTTGASFTILFGSIFVLTSSTVPAMIASALLALATVVVLARVLLLSSLSPDIAAASGVPVRAVGAAFLMALAVSVALSAMIIGAVLSTALLIGPAATALRLARSPVKAAITAASIGVLAIWLGIVLAYDSFYWPPAGRGWPVSFFVVTLVVAGYLLTFLRRRSRQPAPQETPDPEHACSPA